MEIVNIFSEEKIQHIYQISVRYFKILPYTSVVFPISFFLFINCKSYVAKFSAS